MVSTTLDVRAIMTKYCMMTVILLFATASNMAATAAPLFTVSQELGNDGLGYVLLQDATVRGTRTTITVRLDLLAIVVPSNTSAQSVMINRCTFYDSSALVLQGPNRGASNAVAYPNLYLKVVIRNTVFADGNTGLILAGGALRNTIVIIEGCTFTGTSFASGMVAYSSFLSTYAKNLAVAPRCLISGVTLQANTILQFLGNTFSLSSSWSAVSILIDSTSPSANYGLQLQAKSAVVVERCHVTSASGGVAALWFQTAAINSATSTHVRFQSNTGDFTGGALASPVAMGSLVDVLRQPSSASGEATPLVSLLQGFLLVAGNTFRVGTSSGPIIAVDLDQLQCGTNSIVMLLGNTISTFTDGSSSTASAYCPSSSYSTGLVRIPGVVNSGILSIGQNTVTDSGAGTCTSLVSSRGVFSSSSSRVFVQCNTYDGAAPWSPSAMGASALTTSEYSVESTCSANVCFAGNCASLTVTSATAPCSCFCGVGRTDSVYCSDVDVSALLAPVETVTKTRSIILTASSRLTMTKTAALTASARVIHTASTRLTPTSSVPVDSATLNRHVSSTRHRSTRTHTFSAQQSVSLKSFSEDLSTTKGTLSTSASETQSATTSEEWSPSITQSPTEDLSASRTSSRSLSAPATHSVGSMTVTAPTPSSDTTMTSTESATVTMSRTVTLRLTPTATPRESPTPSSTISNEVTSTLTNPVGGLRLNLQRSVAGTVDTLTLSLSVSVTRSKSYRTRTVTDDATRHMVLTFSPSNPQSSGTTTDSALRSASFTASYSMSTSNTRHSPSRWRTLSETMTDSGDMDSQSSTVSPDDTKTLLTLTQSITTSATVSLSNEPSLTETPSAGFRSNTTSPSPTASTETSQSRSPTVSLTTTLTWSQSMPSITRDASRSASWTLSPSDDLTSSPSRPSLTNQGSLTFTPSDVRSATNSPSPEIASVSNTKRPLPSKTHSPTQDSSVSRSTSESPDKSATPTMMFTPSDSATSVATDSHSDSGSTSQSITITLSRSIPSLSADPSITFTGSATMTRTATLSMPSLTHEASLSASSTVSASEELSRSPTKSDSTSYEFGSATTTETSTQTVSTDASMSLSRDRRNGAGGSTTVSETTSQTHSFTVTKNRQDPLHSLTATPSHSRLWLTSSNSSSPSWTFEFASSSRSGTMTSTFSMTLSASPSEELTSSRTLSMSQSLSQSPDESMSRTQSLSSSTTDAVSSTHTFSESITDTATVTIRRSFSRQQLSRSQSISEESTLTESVVPSSTRTFFFPQNNLNSANFFSQFQSRASSCVQMMVYILFPLGVLLLIHLAWSVRTWWSGRGFQHVAVDTYRSVSLFRSLIALHTYASLFYPCHVRCAVLHSLQAICHMTTWTMILLILMDRLGTTNTTLQAMCCLLTLLMAQVLKPLMNLMGYYYRLEDAEDGYTAALDGTAILADTINGSASVRSFSIRPAAGRAGHMNDEAHDGEEEHIDFDMDDSEWEAYRADRSKLFQERIREEDIDIVDDGDSAEKAAPRTSATRSAMGVDHRDSNGGGDDDNDVEIVFDDDGMANVDDGNDNDGMKVNRDGTQSILTLTGSRKEQKSVERNGDATDDDVVAAQTRRRRSRHANTSERGGVDVAAPDTSGKNKKNYGFGELDNFVLFHDDYASFQKRGHQLRLERYADDHAGDDLVAAVPQQQLTPDKDGMDGEAGNAHDGEEANAHDGDGDTLTSSCVSIEVDDDDDGNTGGGIFALGPLASGGGADEVPDENELSISDPRILRTLHYPYLVVLLIVIGVDLWVITGLYRNQADVCSSTLFTLWWVTWLVDAAVCETLYLLAVVGFRYLIREPHEEDIHGRAKASFHGAKRDLRWWRGNLLHPYEGETRYR